MRRPFIDKPKTVFVQIDVCAGVVDETSAEEANPLNLIQINRSCVEGLGKFQRIAPSAVKISAARIRRRGHKRRDFRIEFAA